MIEPPRKRSMRGARTFCQRWSNFDNVFFFSFIFLVDERSKDLNTTISGLSPARQRNAIKWRFAGVPLMAQRLMLAW